MIHYNNDNNAYCSAANAQTFETPTPATAEKKKSVPYQANALSKM